MSITINSNIAALRAIRSLSDSTDAVIKSTLRLSSGLRIDRAADDAAGLSVASNLKYRSIVSNRGYLNVSDGLSTLQITDGALDSVTTLLTRMAELAEQAANGTYASAQRRELNREFNSLDKEIRRIGLTTKFNGLSLLEGERTSRGPKKVYQGTLNGEALANSSDGRYVTFIENSNTIKQIDTETNIVTTLASSISGGIYSVKSSGNGETIAFVADGTVGNFNNSFAADVFTYNRNTGVLKRITNTNTDDDGQETPGLAQSLSLSSDGTTLGFISYDQYASNGTISGSDGTFRYLHTVNLNTGTYSRDISTQFNGYRNFTNLSSNGQYVGASGSNGLGDYHLLISQSSNLNATTNYFGTTPNNQVGSLEISNFGKAYFGLAEDLGGLNPSGFHNLFEISINGNIRKITNSSSGIVDFDSLKISNDGDTLFFNSAGNFASLNSSNYRQLFSMDLTTNAISQVTKYTSNLNTSLIISSDGRFGYYIDAAADLSVYDFRANDLDIGIEAGNGASGQIQVLMGAINSSIGGLGGYTLTSQGSSREALDGTRLNIQKLGQLRGVLGASQSRLSIAGSLLKTMTEQFDAARSRIIDTDVASETADLIKNSILQQAGAALLAQASDQPRLAVTLLKINS